MVISAAFVSCSAEARTHKSKPRSVVARPPTLVVPFRPAPVWPGIVNPLTPELRLELETERARPTLMPRLENLPLPNGVTVLLDRTLKVKLDLATLWQKQIRQPDTYSLTLEAQSGSGWLWLTYRVPGTDAARVVVKP